MGRSSSKGPTDGQGRAAKLARDGLTNDEIGEVMGMKGRRRRRSAERLLEAARRSGVSTDPTDGSDRRRRR